MLTLYYAHALLHRSNRRPQAEARSDASRYLRSRPTAYTLCYVHTIEDHRRKNGVKLQGTYAHALLRTTYYIHAIEEHRKKKGVKPQGTYAHALLRARPTT